MSDPTGTALQNLLIWAYPKKNHPVLKEKTFELISETSDGLKARDVADAIISEYKKESIAWATEKLQQHIIQVVERLLRNVSPKDFNSQMTFDGEDFKECFEENPALPKILGIEDDDLEMVYKPAVACTPEDLQKVDDYTTGQIRGLEERLIAVRRFIDYLEELGVTKDQSLRDFLCSGKK